MTARKTKKELQEENESLLKTLEEASEKLETQDNLLAKALSPPRLHATLLSLNGETADVVLDNGRRYEVNFLPEVKDQLKQGIGVYVNPESMAVLGVKKGTKTGEIAVVEDVYGDSRIKVAYRGEARIVDCKTPVKLGDQVLLDPGLSLVLESFGKKSKEYLLEEIPEIPWGKIGGLNCAIDTLKEAVELPFAYKDLFKKYKKRVPKGVLLYGPAGCGKTLLAKSLAYNLAKKVGEQANGHFMYVKGPEILNPYVGVQEKKVRDIFTRAREKARDNGSPVIVFIDEAEAVLKARGTGISSAILNSVKIAWKERQ